MFGSCPVRGATQFPRRATGSPFTPAPNRDVNPYTRIFSRCAWRVASARLRTPSLR
jgi:hypothetical protein